jgi:fused signal recognition particle receptor
MKENTKYQQWKEGLTKTRSSTFGRIANLFGASEIKADLWDDLEATLIMADLGVDTAMKVVENLQAYVKDSGITKAEELKDALREELRSMLLPIPPLNMQDTPPTVILLAGVNGSGKTTCTAKLGAKFQQEGKNVVFAAADTFRAAAIEQLQSWGECLDIRVVAGQPESDPGAVAYDAVQSAISRKNDVVLIDTAGRLHTRYNLMEELKKIERVVRKPLPSAPHEVWLVLDATTGQNAIKQAQAFSEAISITGVILTKLDLSARGGMAFAIGYILKLPIIYAGLGEKAEDLIPFDADAFIEGILTDFN